MKPHLTDEDYAIAESNGIHRKLAYTRFYQNGWNAERAITFPIQTKKGRGFKELLEEAHENGLNISLTGLQARIYKGMSEEEAVTKPLRKDNRRKQKEHKGELSDVEINRILDMEVRSPHAQWF